MGIMMNSKLQIQIKVLTQATINKQSHHYWGKSTDRKLHTESGFGIVIWSKMA